MGRLRNPNREKAFEIYSENNGKITPKEIAAKLDVNSNIIRNWKSTDEWDIKLGFKRKIGAPKGSKGGTNGGAPKGNLNAFKHGNYIPHERYQSKKFLAKYLPKVTSSIMQELEENQMTALDILWSSIEIKFAAILRSQKIMYVKNKKDLTKVLKKQSWGKTDSEEYELQFAWDKQERFLNAQSKAMATLNKMLESYEEMLNKNLELATEEQKLRIEVLKSKLTGNEIEPIKIEFVRASVKNEKN